jgi:hypothetical protein
MADDYPLENPFSAPQKVVDSKQKTSSRRNSRNLETVSNSSSPSLAPSSSTSTPPSFSSTPTSTSSTSSVSCTQRCCSYRQIAAQSRCQTLVWQLVVTLITLSIFAYSCALLDSKPYAGASCSPEASCSSPTKGCFSLYLQNTKCADLCGSTSYDPIGPLRFSLARDASSSLQKGLAVSCGFPKNNINWRIPLSLFTGVASIAAMMSVRYKRRLNLLVLGLLLISSGLIFLYVMVIDGIAVDKSSSLCKDGFIKAVNLVTYVNDKNLPKPLTDIQCEYERFQAMVVLDFFVSPILIFVGLVTIGHRNFIASSQEETPRQDLKGANSIDPTTIEFGK